MVLTFEVSEDKESLHIFFDEEGRDQLVQRLIDCREPGDHYHLMPEGASVPGFAVTTKRFLEDAKTVSWVDLGLLTRDRTPIESEGNSDA